MRWLERHSHEDWMNDMATNDIAEGTQMDKAEMVRIAKIAIDKRMDYETLKDSDWMYGKEDLTDDVWAFVEECDKIGRAAFWAKCPDA